MHVRRFAVLATASLAVVACSPAHDAARAPAIAPARPAASPPPAPSLAALPDIDHTIANLVAFTKLFGYVRYFHPSDEAANADWEALAVGAVPRVEHARDAAELAASLDAVFRPVAPTLRVYPSGHAPAPPAELRPPAGEKDPTYVGWVHHGLPSDTPYWSVRASNKATPHGRPGELMAVVTLPPGKHARLRVKAWVRTEGTSAGGGAVLATTYLWDTQEKTGPVASPHWAEIEHVTDVSDDEKTAIVALRLVGEGKLWVDDVRAWVEDPKGVTPVVVDNGDFERGKDGGPVLGWLEAGNDTGGYRVHLSSDRAHGGARNAEIEAVALPIESLPTPDQTCHRSLGAGVDVDLPLTVYVDASGRTLPTAAMHAEASFEPITKRVARYSANDRAVRIADVALAWNVAEHFYPYFEEVKTDWPAALETALARAIADADERKFHTTLRTMWAALHDGHGAVSRFETAPDGSLKPQPRAALPLMWRIVEGKLVVTAVRQGGGDVKVGDVALAIDGQPIGAALDDQRPTISAATPQDADYWASVRLLMQDAGSLHRVTFARGASGATYDATLEASVPVDRFSSNDRDTTAAIRDVQAGVMYVDLDRVTDDDVEAALPKLVAAKGVVLDMRGYPNAVANSLSHFFAAPLLASKSWIPTVTRPDRDGATWTEWRGSPHETRAPQVRGKLAFLIDARAISNAEWLLENVVRQKNGVLVGSPTAGTDGNVVIFWLPGALSLRMTGLKVTHFDGSQLHGIGILPTVPCAPTIAGIAAGKDEVLECGIRAVSPVAR